MNFKRLTGLFFLAMLLYLTGVNEAICTTYYIKNSGNDKSSGLSDAQAWKTIAKMNDFAEQSGFRDGDVIQLRRGDTWSADEVIGYNGQRSINWGKINRLTIQAYGTGNKPWINCNSTQAIRFMGDNSVANLTIKDIDASGRDWSVGQDVYNVYVDSVNGVTVDGLYIDAHRGSGTDTKHGGLKILNCNGNIDVKNCEIKNIKKHSGFWEADAHGLFIWYDGGTEGAAKKSGTVYIRNNILHDIEADCIQIGGINTVSNIHDNKVYNFGENGIDIKACRKVNIYGNEIYWNNFGSGGSGGQPCGISLHNSDGWPTNTIRDIVIQNNFFRDTGTTVIRLLEGSGIDIYENYFKDVRTGVEIAAMGDVAIFNNIFNLRIAYNGSGTEQSAIRFKNNNSKRQCRVNNNTIYIKNEGHLYGIGYQRDPGDFDNLVENNIIYIDRNSSRAYPFYLDPSKSGSNPVLRSNLYFNPNHTNRVYWNSEYVEADLSKWRNNIDSQAIFSDPLFVNASAGEFALKSNSPGILSGNTLGANSEIEQTPSLSPPTSLRVAQ